MRSSTFVRSLLLGVALTGALACADPTEGKPEAVVGEAQSHDGDSAEGMVYVIGDESTIGFVGSKVTGQHDGGFNVFEGEIEVVNGDPTQSRVTVTIDTTSIWADNDRLTGHLKSDDFFGVETYPVASFESTSITENADGGYTITGNLDLHGVTKSISFPADIQVDETTATATAEFSIKRFDWNIEYKGKADDLIRDDVLIRLDLMATPATAGAA